MDQTSITRPKPVDYIPGYKLEKLVGKGGMGEVHQATQLSLGRTVAVKLLNTELAKDDSFVARFEKEGAALATLRHPNIVSIVDRGRNQTTYYLVMEFVDGPSLREVMRSPLLDAAQSIRMMLQICRAIEYAHSRGVIHRDLKPENILFDEQAGGIAKVTDFGLAGFDERAGQRKLNLTQTNVAMGTASYMAPEQQVDARSADHRADIYSLGVILYELLTGDLPMGNFDAPSVKKPQLDKRLDAIVARCLKTAAAERYASVAEMLTELEPMVPATSMLGTVQMSPMRRALDKMRAVARSAMRVFEVAMVVSAVLIVATAYLRGAAKAVRQPSGQELATDFSARWPMTVPGRLDRETRSVSLGDGPDVVSLVASGRKPQLVQSEVVYRAGDEAPSGRVTVDTNLDGDGLKVTVLAESQSQPRSRLEPIKEIFRGPRPEARAALMLLGEPGRYVALVVSGGGADPTLEWALGTEHRGTMSAPMPLAGGALQLELRVDPVTGELSALVGKDRDQRPLADPLSLGPKWKELFGGPVRAAMGCLEGACRFSRLASAALLKPAPALPVPPVAVAPAEGDAASKVPGKSVAQVGLTRKPPVKVPAPSPPVLIKKPLPAPPRKK